MKTWKRGVLGVFGLCLAAITFGFLLFANIAMRRDDGATAPLPRAQAIVALTGGAQRIRAAGNLLRQGRAERLLITGVNRIVSRGQLRKMLQVDARLFACCVDVDYAAQNTRGNAVETLKWARRNEFNSLIVVTSSYHMPRSLTELGRLLPAVDLIAYPVVPDRLATAPWWLDRDTITRLGAEYLKLLPSAAQFAWARIAGPPKTESDRQPALTQRAVAVQ